MILHWLGRITLWVVGVCAIGFAEAIADSILGITGARFPSDPAYYSGVAVTLLSIWAFRS